MLSGLIKRSWVAGSFETYAKQWSALQGKGEHIYSTNLHYHHTFDSLYTMQAKPYAAATRILSLLW